MDIMSETQGLITLNDDPWKDDVKEKLDGIKKSIEALDIAITKQTEELSSISKMNALNFAIKNTSLGEFQYFDEFGRREKSSSMVFEIIHAFRRNDGACLPETATMKVISSSPSVEQEKNKLKTAFQAAFRTALQKQIYGLTCSNPRISQENGHYVIYYS